MSEANPREELRAALDELTDEQARTLLRWAQALREQSRLLARPPGRRPASAEEERLGMLGELLGIERDAREPGFCRMRLPVGRALYNPHGVLHGGVVYTMIDYSMGGAVMASLPEGQRCTTIEAKVSYLAPVREASLTVETRVVKLGRSIAFTESKVTDDAGRLVATGSGSMFILGQPAE